MPVKIIEKLSEGRVFFDLTANVPREGEPVKPLSTEREQAMAVLAKLEWEGKNPARQIIRFYKDPSAGGLRPVVDPVTKQVTPHSYPLWVGEVIERQFPDDEAAAAWRAAHA